MAAVRGDPAVLVHGWGMGPQVFADLCGRLPSGLEACCPALPGCAGSPDAETGADGLAALADRVAAATDRPAHWIGWSLGGLVALEVARRAPRVVARVTLVAAAPRMAAGPGWPGIDPVALNGFREDLMADPSATHDRFLALQVRGSAGARHTLRALRHAAATDGLPTPRALRMGLDVLAQTDLRPALGALSCPVDAVLGERDALAPVSLAAHLETLGIPARMIPGAGHAPFVSHPDLFTAALLE